MTMTPERIEMIKRIKETNAFVGLALNFEDISFVGACLDMCIEGTKDAPEWQENIKRISAYIQEQTIKVMNEESISIQYSDLLGKMSTRIIEDEFRS